MVLTQARALPYLVRPDRYAAEGVRDWVAATFPVYGIVEPTPATVHVSGKGRGGHRPRWAPAWWPERFSMRLHSLHVRFRGDGWQVKVTSSARDHAIHEHVHQMMADRWTNGFDHAERPSEPWRGELLVDGVPVEFRGARGDAQWSCDALVDRGSIHMQGSGVDPSTLMLERMRDPGPALQGQREMERRRRGR